MFTERLFGAKVIIRNDSGTSYLINELGIEIANGEEIDLLDDSMLNFYCSWEEANNLVTKPNKSQLWNDINDGKIMVIESKKPIMRPEFFYG